MFKKWKKSPPDSNTLSKKFKKIRRAKMVFIIMVTNLLFYWFMIYPFKKENIPEKKQEYQSKKIKKSKRENRHEILF